MNSLFSFFQTNADDICSDEEEMDQMCQCLVELSKQIAIIQSSSYTNIKIKDSVEKLKANIETLNIVITNGFQLVSIYDFQDVRFNGYRSIFTIIKKCMNELISSMRKVSRVTTFNRVKHERKCKDYMKFLSELTKIAQHLMQMMIVQRENKCLFINKNDNEIVYQSILECFEKLEADIFYGQCLGFYLCEPCQFLAKVFCSIQLGMGQAMALPKSKLEVFVSTVVNSAQSWWMERKRASQMADLYRQSTVKFCKQFWNLVDHPVVLSVSHLVLPYLKIIKEMTLQPTPLQLPLVDNPDESIKISPPVAHNGFQEVKIRLLSKTCRQGMEWIYPGNSAFSYSDSSNCLLIHIHGGGFVAQSSQSHDGYLRQWAIDLDYPIVSIDYSHAPEYPFPRAHEECLYAYAWVLRNLSQFGCSPDCKIIICGDSAGGNLALGCLVKVLQLNIRAPNAIILAYPAVLIDFVPSPARFVGGFCPILPMGILARCLLAYGGVNEEILVKNMNKNPQSDEKEISAKTYTDSFLDHDSYNSKGERIFYSRSDLISPIALLLNANLPSDPIMSPILAEDEIYRKFPPLSVFASEFDPLLDDSIEICKKVSNAGGRDVNLQVMRSLPHGFLSLASPMTKDCLNANKLYVEEIKRLFQKISD